MVDPSPARTAFLRTLTKILVSASPAARRDLYAAWQAYGSEPSFSDEIDVLLVAVLETIDAAGESNQ